MAAGIIALVVRGFKVSDLTTPNATVSTPAMVKWLVKVPDYPEKMTAYKEAINGEKYGYAICVAAENEYWCWYADVYDTAELAQQSLTTGNLPATATYGEYNVAGKKFTVAKSMAELCNAALSLLPKIYTQLQSLRTAVVQQQVTSAMILSITDVYNALKEKVGQLNTLNETSQSMLISTIVFAINQNILCLHDLIFTEPTAAHYLSLVNTAMIKNIFSLDNF